MGHRPDICHSYWDCTASKIAVTFEYLVFPDRCRNDNVSDTGPGIHTSNAVKDVEELYF
jgi:hypothetical protein